MTRQVSSSVYGGAVVVADQDDYRRLHDALHAQAAVLSSAAARWTQTACTLSAQRDRLRWCPAAGTPDGGGNATHGDPAPRIDAARASSDAMGRRCRELADECARLADLVARAHSLYAEAELRNRRLVNRAVGTLTVAHPVGAAMAAGALALAGVAVGSLHEGALNWTYASKATSWAQEGLMSGLGGLVSGASPRSLASHGSVNAAAGYLAPVGATLNDVVQGDALSVRRVSDDRLTVGGADGIQDALHDLRRLGEANARGTDDGEGLSYGTIAISRYARDDGSTAWLVTIPGTDGRADSPFGWPQNLELMSADAAQRRHADSARMVAQAMAQAGVSPDDPVAVIGHSQGGIVAATLAADYADDYRIEHVVTAGSPIANHPIDARTWVTSVEMDDELVAALDGDANPAGERWLTVRGTLRDIDGTDARLLPGRVIEDDDGPYSLTHDLKYHEAALGHAMDLGSPAVQTHDAHFRDTIGGAYQGTTYWQGRMGHDPADGERDGR